MSIKIKKKGRSTVLENTDTKQKTVCNESLVYSKGATCISFESLSLRNWHINAKTLHEDTLAELILTEDSTLEEVFDAFVVAEFFSKD